ncbi:MAG: ATP-binding cassette domain-containing protein [Rikenellaceae bacterium]
MELLDNRYTLEIDSVELHFGNRTIISSAYIRVETGTITALLGRNGCGKSCLMRIICGDLKAQNSSIHINSIWQPRLNHNQVVYSPQYNILPKNLTLQTIFDDYEVCFDTFALHFPEFAKLKEQKVENMSGGEQRIVNIYIVLNSKSQFAMLDEPFSQIMPIHVTKIKELIKEAAHTKGILITDHMYRNILDITDSLYIMSNTTIYSAKSKDDLVRYGYLKSVD